MALSEREISQLILKLRNKYKEAAAGYDRRFFNIDAFEDRYQMALKKRMNLEAFILAEISNFEKIKQRFEEKQNDEKPDDSFSKQADSIIEENITRIKKYKPIPFHEHAGIEIIHFYGALKDFTTHYFSILFLIIDDYEYKDKIYKFDNMLADFVQPIAKKHPKRIDDHILVLSRTVRKEIEIEHSKNHFLKDAALILHDIIDFAEKLLKSRNKEWDNPLRFDKLYIQGESKKRILSIFNGTTPYGAILMIMEQAKAILKDFRLESFKKKAAV